MRKLLSLLLINLFLCTGIAKGQVFYALPESFSKKDTFEIHTSLFLEALNREHVTQAQSEMERAIVALPANNPAIVSAFKHWFTAQFNLNQLQYSGAFKSACQGLLQIQEVKAYSELTDELMLAFIIQLTESAIEGFRNSGRDFFIHIQAEGNKKCNSGIELDLNSLSKLVDQQASYILNNALAKFLSKLRGATYSGNNRFLSILAMQSEWYWYNFIGEHEQAEKALRLALSNLDDLQKSHLQHSQLKQPAFMNGLRIDLQGRLAVTLIRLNKFQAAQFFLQQNIRLAKAHEFKHKLENEYFNIAYVYRALGQYPLAKRYYEYSKALAIELGRESEYIALNDINLGRLYRLEGNPEKAWEVHNEIAANIAFKKYQYFESVLLFELLNDAKALRNFPKVKTIADVLLKDDRPVESQQIGTLLILLETAIELAEEDNTNKYILALQKRLAKSPDAYRTQFIEFARLRIEKWQKFGGHEPKEVERLLIEVMSIIQGVMSQTGKPEAWIEVTQRFYVSFTALMLQQMELEKETQTNLADNPEARNLFNILDQNSAAGFALLKQKTQNKIDRSSASTELEISWNKLLRAEYQLIQASQLPEKQYDVALEMTRSRKELDNAREHYLSTVWFEEVAAIEKFSFDLNRGLPQLPPEEILLRFHISERQSVVFVVYDQGRKINIRKLPDKATIENWIAELPLHQLGRRLTKGFVETPLKKLLPLDLLQDERYQRIVWIPDGPLHQLPLAAVNLSPSPNRYSPLGLRVEVVRTHSASDYYQQVVKKASLDSLQVALFAAPTFKHKDLSVQENSVDPIEQSFHQWQGALPNLPSSRLEAESVQNLFKSTNAQIHIALGDEANNDFLLSEQVREADILHISTHGYFNPDTHDIVGLATSRVSPSGRDNGFLGLSELLSKPFNNQLVLISGCETMLGEMYDGTGMNGLTHGMLSRGVGATIGTLWKVFDRPTSKFKSAFYRALLTNGGNIPKAMQSAQKEMRDNVRFRDPKYWAGFVLTSSNQSQNIIANQ